MKVLLTKFYKAVLLMSFGWVVLTPSFAQTITIAESVCLDNPALTLNFSTSDGGNPEQ